MRFSRNSCAIQAPPAYIALVPEHRSPSDANMAAVRSPALDLARSKFFTTAEQYFVEPYDHVSLYSTLTPCVITRPADKTYDSLLFCGIQEEEVAYLAFQSAVRIAKQSPDDLVVLIDLTSASSMPSLLALAGRLEFLARAELCNRTFASYLERCLDAESADDDPLPQNALVWPAAASETAPPNLLLSPSGGELDRAKLKILTDRMSGHIDAGSDSDPVATWMHVASFIRAFQERLASVSRGARHIVFVLCADADSSALLKQAMVACHAAFLVVPHRFRDSEEYDNCEKLSGFLLGVDHDGLFWARANRFHVVTGKFMAIIRDKAAETHLENTEICRDMRYAPKRLCDYVKSLKHGNRVYIIDVPVQTMLHVKKQLHEPWPPRGFPQELAIWLAKVKYSTKRT